VSARPRAGSDRGVPFYKLTGSGNDFVFFDVRAGRPALAADASAVAALCARGTGVGADGWCFSTRPRPGSRASST
jgi:diaminopimelate epimerase